MKKILSVLLLAAMLVGCVMPSLVSAAGEPLSLTVVGPEAVSALDKTVELAIELDGNDDSGVWGATFAVAYTKGWTVSSIENGDLWAAEEFDTNDEDIAVDAYADFDTPEKIDAEAYDIALIHVEKDSTEEIVTANGVVAKVVLAAPEDLAGGEKLEVKLAYDAMDPMTRDAEGNVVDVAFNVTSYEAVVTACPTVSAANVEVGPDDEYVAVDVTLENFPEVKSMTIYDVEYDKTALELVDEAEINGETVATGWTIDGFATNVFVMDPEYAVFTSAANIDANGVVFTFVFKVIAEENTESAVSFGFTAKTKPEGEVETEIAGIKTVAGSVKITVDTVVLYDFDGNGKFELEDVEELLRLYSFEEWEPDVPNPAFNQTPDIDDNGIFELEDIEALLLIYSFG